MKKQLKAFAIILLLASLSFQLNAQKATISHKISVSGYNSTGEWYEIIGEITNNSGKMLRGITVNVNYFDASGKKLTGSNFLEDNQKQDFSDSQSAGTDYLAKNASVPFKFLRFSDKINGKVAKVELTVTGTIIKAPTAAIVENIKTQRVLDFGTTYNQKVSGTIKCTAGKCFSCGVIVGSYDESGKLIDYHDYIIEGAEELIAGQAKAFSFDVPEDGKKVAKIKVFPLYRGDWDEE